MRNTVYLIHARRVEALIATTYDELDRALPPEFFPHNTIRTHLDHAINLTRKLIDDLENPGTREED